MTAYGLAILINEPQRARSMKPIVVFQHVSLIVHFRKIHRASGGGFLVRRSALLVLWRVAVSKRPGRSSTQREHESRACERDDACVVGVFSLAYFYASYYKVSFFSRTALTTSTVWLIFSTYYKGLSINCGKITIKSGSLSSILFMVVENSWLA